MGFGWLNGLLGTVGTLVTIGLGWRQISIWKKLELEAKRQKAAESRRNSVSPSLTLKEIDALKVLDEETLEKNYLQLRRKLHHELRIYVVEFSFVNEDDRVFAEIERDAKTLLFHVFLTEVKPGYYGPDFSLKYSGTPRHQTLAFNHSFRFDAGSQTEHAFSLLKDAYISTVAKGPSQGTASNKDDSNKGGLRGANPPSPPPDLPTIKTAPSPESPSTPVVVRGPALSTDSPAPRLSREESRILHGLPPQILEKYLDLRAAVMQFGTDVRVGTSQSYIKFSARSNFAYIQPRVRACGMHITVRLAPESVAIAENGSTQVSGVTVSRVSDSDSGRPNSYSFEVESGTDIGAVKGLLRQSYEAISAAPAASLKEPPPMAADIEETSPVPLERTQGHATILDSEGTAVAPGIPEGTEQNEDIEDAEANADLKAVAHAPKTTEVGFLAACSDADRPLFVDAFNYMRSKRIELEWGTKGVSIRGWGHRTVMHMFPVGPKKIRVIKAKISQSRINTARSILDDNNINSRWGFEPHEMKFEEFKRLCEALT